MKIAIIGAGNGGQAMAAHFSLLNHEVRLYNRSENRLYPIIKNQGIQLSGALNDFVGIHLITNKIEEAVNGAEIIMVTTTANAHKDLAVHMAPFLEEGQIVVLNPGRTFGALEFSQAIGSHCFSKIRLAEAQSLIYACRADNNGNVNIIGIKNRVMLAAFPSAKTSEIASILNSIYPCFEAVENVLVTGLENIGSILHPTVILFNAATIERGTDFYFYNDMTPRVANVLEQVDKERLSIGDALGLKLNSISDWVSYAYEGITGNSLCEKMRNNPAYDQILAPRELRSRLLLEDIPTGILPMMELAKFLKVPTPLMSSIFNISQALLDENFKETGRTFKSLGFENKSIHEFIASL